MVMNIVRRIALKAILDKAKELHQKGKTVEEIADKFLAEPKIVEGLVALGIDRDELIKMIEDKVK